MSREENTLSFFLTSQLSIAAARKSNLMDLRRHWGMVKLQGLSSEMPRGFQ